jgi:trimeric autotransporter adhesin
MKTITNIIAPNFAAIAVACVILSPLAGNNNTADGQNALLNNTTGRYNIGIGSNAGYNITTGNNNIDIANGGVAAESGKIRIGTSGRQTGVYVAGISGAAVSGSTVTVNSSGQLGVAPSSQRFKQNILPMGDVSEVLIKLEPVTFRYKHDIDPNGTPQFGLVAEEVEKIAPGLVVRDEHGKPYTVRYDAVNVMLLNEFLKEHKKVQDQQATIMQLKSSLAEQHEEIAALRSQIQKVSDRVNASKTAPQMVADDR